MKKILALTSLIIVYSSVAAYSANPWRFIQRTGSQDIYLLEPSVQRSGSIVQFYWMYSGKKQIRSGTRREGYYNYMSSTSETEVDCVTKKYRPNAARFYEGEMATKLVPENSPRTRQWFDVEMSAGIKYLLPIVCR